MSVEKPCLAKEFERTKTLIDLDKLLKKTRCDINFFGAVNVYHEEYENSVSLKHVTQKALAYINGRLIKWDFDETIREAIDRISNKIDHFYNARDKKLKKINIITKIFYLIRRIFSFINRTEHRWKYLSKNIDPKNYYTKLQFEKSFPKNEIKDHEKLYNNRRLYLPPIIID
jgi:hypothetical protein